ncbi:MAG TPA: hypothetical protein VI564_05055 [Candidatus Nanoarchaeia archaeon]|nr:hypothetical protein [Candidatus Nanoarchaeia archaeon]
MGWNNIKAKRIEIYELIAKLLEEDAKKYGTGNSHEIIESRVFEGQLKLAATSMKKATDAFKVMLTETGSGFAEEKIKLG